MIEAREKMVADAPVRLPRVLNVGSGTLSNRSRHPVFGTGWEEIRLDIDASTKPDILASITNMREAVASQSMDAIFASHIMEHLYDHEVMQALSEFRRVLRPDGFLIINSPDVEIVAQIILEHGLDHVVYQSPAGPISAADMLYGHGRSIKAGNVFMAHKTGFTCARLGNMLIDCGFPTVLAKRGDRYDLWAVALMENADQQAIQSALKRNGLDMF